MSTATMVAAGGIFGATNDLIRQASYTGVALLLGAVAFVALKHLFQRGVGSAIAAALGVIAVAVIAGNAFGIYSSTSSELNKHGVQSGTCGTYCR
ncbi:hypothetical protein [Tsukamurella ocularis]|uniref:hypothetical protein n=1 Tax=Tsukamurella ocularis TaxID=1970234 RepID=UPI0021690411|nr:hypothetical protein [Tsukamurella ocularis]MCS3853339.1 hypothetical protein [Tsukamurella ocularis]